MVFVGILPYTVVNNQYLFLLGQESKGRDINTWSGFGGNLEQNETIYQGAAREAYEESMGALGTYEELLAEIDQKPYHLHGHRNGYSFLVYREYNPELTAFYKRAYDYVRKFTPNPPEGYLEKRAVRWFSAEEIISNPNIIRKPFLITFNEIWKLNRTR